MASIFTNGLLAPEAEDDSYGANEKFSFDDLLSNYVEFEFNGGSNEVISNMGDIEFDVDHLKNFTDELLNTAKNYSNVTGSEYEAREASGEGLKVELFDKETNESVGTIDVDVNINMALYKMPLPNGDTLHDMENYGWDKFKELESMAQEADFAKGVEAISTPEEGMEQ